MFGRVLFLLWSLCPCPFLQAPKTRPFGRVSGALWHFGTQTRTNTPCGVFVRVYLSIFTVTPVKTRPTTTRHDEHAQRARLSRLVVVIISRPLTAPNKHQKRERTRHMACSFVSTHNAPKRPDHIVTTKRQRDGGAGTTRKRAKGRAYKVRSPFFFFLIYFY